MGNTNAAITTQYFHQWIAPHSRITAASMLGLRDNMEDRHVVQVSLAPKFPHVTLVAVMDGHLGNTAASTLSQQLVTLLQSCNDIHDTEAISKVLVDWDTKCVREWTQNEIQLQQNAGRLHEDEVKKGIAQALYGENAKPIYELGRHMSGTTLVMALVYPDPNHNDQIKAQIANVGDSVCSVVRADGHIQVITTDHKPTRDTERQRILSQTTGLAYVANGRVNGDLALTRAFFDAYLKNNPNIDEYHQAVIAQPEWYSCTLRKGDTLLLYSDGLTEYTSSVDLLNYWTTHLYHAARKQPAIVTSLSNLLDYALHTNGSGDNMTMIAVEIGSFSYLKQHSDNNIIDYKKCHCSGIRLEPLDTTYVKDADTKRQEQDFKEHQLSIDDIQVLNDWQQQIPNDSNFDIDVPKIAQYIVDGKYIPYSLLDKFSQRIYNNKDENNNNIKENIIDVAVTTSENAKPRTKQQRQSIKTTTKKEKQSLPSTSISKRNRLTRANSNRAINH